MGPTLLDGIEVGRVGRQVEQFCVYGLDSVSITDGGRFGRQGGRLADELPELLHRSRKILELALLVHRHHLGGDPIGNDGRGAAGGEGRAIEYGCDEVFNAGVV